MTKKLQLFQVLMQWNMYQISGGQSEVQIE
jgi:hypothetical protein